MTTRYLVDTSAFFRLVRDAGLRERWRDQLDAGLFAVCPLTELEILHAARSKSHSDELDRILRRGYGWVVIPDRAFDRAQGVQKGLADRGAHRSAGPIDLVVAATAEQHRMTVLHYDGDFAQVAAVTGQPVRWLAEPGSIA